MIRLRAGALCAAQYQYACSACTSSLATRRPCLRFLPALTCSSTPITGRPYATVKKAQHEARTPGVTVPTNSDPQHGQEEGPVEEPGTRSTGEGVTSTANDVENCTQKPATRSRAKSGRGTKRKKGQRDEVIDNPDRLLSKALLRLHQVEPIQSQGGEGVRAAEDGLEAGGETPMKSSSKNPKSPSQVSATQEESSALGGSDNLTIEQTEDIAVAQDQVGAAPLAGEGEVAQVEDGKAAKESTESTTATGKHRSRLPRKSTTRRSKVNWTIRTVWSDALRLTPIKCPQPPVPAVSYGLDRALFNPGVYHLQDPLSRVFNFDPYLANIMPLREFDFNALKQYITSSKDQALISMAAEHGKKYAGSTSSMTSMLSHFHYLLSAWRPICIDMMSRSFRPDSVNFTRINRAPAAAFLHYKDGTYAIDADKEFDTANILSMLGKSMEKLLTLPKEEYEKYRRINSDQLTPGQRNDPESYHYTTMGDLIMRSQLDAHDRRLPGTGMFDLKTRAVVSIRMDAKDFHKGLGYEIRHRFGQWESFEREYYDMIRSAFLKYSLQVRMGRMDGIFVAFHNTERIFGFQYISKSEMDQSLHGTSQNIGDVEFKLSLHLLNQAFNRVTERFPKTSLRLHFEARPSESPFMYIFAKPMTSEDIEEVQGANKAAVEEFERNVMGLGATEAEEKDLDPGLGEGDEAADTKILGMKGLKGSSKLNKKKSRGLQAKYAAWQGMMDKVEETLEDDEKGVMSVREAIEDAMEHVGLLRAYSSEESRRYLDSMLEAITGGHSVSGSARRASEKPEPTAVLTADDSGDYEAADWKVCDAKGLGELAEGGSAGASQPDEGGGNPATSQPGPPESPSLKDLILQLPQFTGEVASEPPAKSKNVAQTSEQMRLHKFEEILSELRARSLQKGETGPSNGPENDAETAADVDTAGSTSSASAPFEPPFELFGMALTIKNKVNGEYVTRPNKLGDDSKWDVEYIFKTLSQEQAHRTYKMMLARRKNRLTAAADDESTWYGMWRKNLHKITEQGREFRENLDASQRTRPVHVYGVDKPLRGTDVFGGLKQSDKAKPAVIQKGEGSEPASEPRTTTTTKGQEAGHGRMPTRPGGAKKQQPARE